jgi:hypothetical protein
MRMIDKRAASYARSPYSTLHLLVFHKNHSQNIPSNESLFYGHNFQVHCPPELVTIIAEITK